MNWFLTIIIAVLVIMVLVSLVRGIIAFLQSTKLDLENPDDADRASRMQEQQNKMMFNRIKYQALAIIAVMILVAISG